MEFSVVQINRIFSSYESQFRIAKLNKKANIRSIQGQVDRIDISPQARKLTALKLISNVAITKTK